MVYRNTTPVRRNKQELVIGVGSRAFVNWLPAPSRAAGGVPMLDGAGTLIHNDLCDGQEVEIVSWRPRSREGLSYQVRRVSDGSEWWVSATYLRRSAAMAAPVAKAPLQEER
jgi:hypothetical protein